MGRCLRQIHDLGLPVQKNKNNSWKDFLETQVAGCYARHKEIGLREDLPRQIPDFLKGVKLDTDGICFLHTEVMRDHVFFTDHEGQLLFQGFIDFEPSSCGPA